MFYLASRLPVIFLVQCFLQCIFPRRRCTDTKRVVHCKGAKAKLQMFALNLLYIFHSSCFSWRWQGRSVGRSATLDRNMSTSFGCLYFHSCPWGWSLVMFAKSSTVIGWIVIISVDSSPCILNSSRNTVATCALSSICLMTTTVIGPLGNNGNSSSHLHKPALKQDNRPWCHEDWSLE